LFWAGTGATDSVIEYGPTQVGAAHTLAAAIPGATLKPNDQLGTDLELVLGSSYSGAQAPGSPAASAPPAATSSTGTTAADATCTA
jgi:hypothetical protein